MNINGEKLINALCKRLKDRGIPPHDSSIVNLLGGLSNFELNQLVTFGDIDRWIRERNNKELNKQQ